MSRISQGEEDWLTKKVLVGEEAVDATITC